MNNQLLFPQTPSTMDLIITRQKPARFDGPGLTTRDTERLVGQLKDVYEIFADGKWHREGDIAHKLGIKEQSVGARRRDLRKEHFGGYTIERRKVEGVEGLNEYRMVK